MGGVIDKLPHLKMMFAHGGGAFPGTLPRIEWGYKTRPDLVAKDCNQNSHPDPIFNPNPNPNPNPNSNSKDSSVGPTELCKRLYVDSLTHDETLLKGTNPNPNSNPDPNSVTPDETLLKGPISIFGASNPNPNPNPKRSNIYFWSVPYRPRKRLPFPPR